MDRNIRDSALGARSGQAGRGLVREVAPAGALMVNRHLTVGQKAPSFQTNTLKDDGLHVGQPNQFAFFSPRLPNLQDPAAGFKWD